MTTGQRNTNPDYKSAIRARCAPVSRLVALGVRSPVRVIASLLLLSACSSSPSPEQLQETLVKHPEILYSVVRAHPQEFIRVLNSAALASRDAQAESDAKAFQAKIDSEFANPKHPALAGHVSLGPENAPITLVEYADFQCPYCRAERETVAEILREYAGKIRFVVKQMPLDSHPQAMSAALMFEAVAQQGSTPAIRYFDAMYTEQDRLGEGRAFLEDAARRAGADVQQARRDAASDAISARVLADLDEARRFGFNGTPGFLINGVALEGAYPKTAFEQIINRQLAALGVR
jgi:protein-disulfide isomerase